MAGVLDTTFGSNGTVTDYYSGTIDSYIYSVLLDNSNRIVIAGYHDNNTEKYGLARFLANGQLDTTFGTGGKVSGNFSDLNSSSLSSFIYAAVIDNSNNIVCGGLHDYNRYALAKFLSNGQLDTTFGTNGMVLDNFYGSTFSQINAIAIDGSNNIIVGGYILSTSRYAVARFLTNGQLDSTFGTGGIVLNYFTGTTKSIINSVVIDGSNNIVIAGSSGISTLNYGIARLQPNGQPDTTFGTGGTITGVFSGTNSSISAIAIDDTNKIVVGGVSTNQYVVARFLADGQIDTSFGTSGIELGYFTGSYSKIFSIAIDSLGRILAYGYNNMGQNLYGLARFLADGQLDTTFGSGGKVLVTTSIGPSTEKPAFTLDTFNNIIVGGSLNPSPNAFFVSKYLTSDTPPVSNVCFPAGTLISTNQGNIPIEKINPSKHTVRNKKIVGITRTVVCDKYTVCFEKGALGNNIPSQTTCISKNHKIFYKGQMVKAYEFIGTFPNIYKQPYHGETLYNVLLEEHDKMVVNNLICETLHPENPLAKLYILLQKFAPDQQQKIINKYNHMHMKK